MDNLRFNTIDNIEEYVSDLQLSEISLFCTADPLSDLSGKCLLALKKVDKNNYMFFNDHLEIDVKVNTDFYHETKELLGIDPTDEILAAKFSEFREECLVAKLKSIKTRLPTKDIVYSDFNKNKDSYNIIAASVRGTTMLGVSDVNDDYYSDVYGILGDGYIIVTDKEILKITDFDLVKSHV